MKISILGSTGFLGKVLLKKALDGGHEIRTLVRDPEKLGDFKDRVEFVVGNTFDPKDIEKAVTGTEAVISTVGPPQGKPVEANDYKEAMEHLVAVLKRNKIRRYIHTGGAMHDGGDDEEWTIRRNILRFLLDIIYGPGLAAKRLEWDVLKTSGLDWTLVRPPRIAKKKPSGVLIAEEKKLASLHVWVEDLADFILEQIASKEWIGKAPLVAAGKK